MKVEVKGIIKEIFAENVISEKFKKREFILEVPSGDYSETLKIQSVNDKCDFLNGFAVNDEVDVTFFVGGRPWTNAEGKVSYFTTLSCGFIKKVEEEVEKAPVAVSGNDDLPF